MYVHKIIHICTHIYKEREQDRERKSDRDREMEIEIARQRERYLKELARVILKAW